MNKLRIEFVLFLLSKSSNYGTLRVNELDEVDGIFKLQGAITEIMETSSRFKISPRRMRNLERGRETAIKAVLSPFPPSDRG